MTLKELAVAILSLPSADLDKPAEVYPPNACPESSRVRVTGLVATPGRPLISTGKPEQA